MSRGPIEMLLDFEVHCSGQGQLVRRFPARVRPRYNGIDYEYQGQAPAFEI
jgi:hypothetical protein